MAPNFDFGDTDSSFKFTVLWKLVERLTIPKSDRSSSERNKSPAQEAKWSFGAGINLFPNLTAKIDREAKLKLNDFAKELRTFRSVDMTGTTLRELMET